MHELFSRLKRLSPVRLAFVGSLLLSLIAVLGTRVIDRDAALYLTIAQQIIDQGPHVAFQVFDWPWFIFLLVGTHTLLHLPLLLSASLWCGLFMAGTCALMVDIVRQKVPAASYWACLVVLAMPAFNQFRYDILREFGFWFFCVLAVWQAMRWQARGGWGQAVLIHLAIACAALFRLEALMVLPALLIWQLLEVRRGHWGRILQFASLPAVAAVLVALYVLTQGGLISGVLTITSICSIRIRCLAHLIRCRSSLATAWLTSTREMRLAESYFSACWRRC